MSDDSGQAQAANATHRPLPLLRHVVYCSLATRAMDEDEIGQLVALAQRHNLARNITGMLAFANGVFFQWIEGPRVQIERLMAILHRDPRHHDLVTLSESEEVRKRLYPDWDMQSVGADYIRQVIEDARSASDDAHNSAALDRMLAQLDAGPFETLGRR